MRAWSPSGHYPNGKARSVAENPGRDRVVTHLPRIATVV